VPWYEVFDYMHLPLRFAKKSEEIEVIRAVKSTYQEEWIDNDEVEQILNRTFSANKKEKSLPTRGKKVITAPSSPSYSRPISTDNREEYLLVDGYNIIFAWEDLSQLAKVNINSAREKLQDILCNYQGMKGCQVIVVFDAYRVQGHQTEILDYHNIHVVYTKEAETADQYIEKFAHEKSKKYKITVATSDGLEQIIIRGQGCLLLSAREFEKEVHNALENLRQQHLQMPASKKNYLIDALTDKEKEQLNTLDSE
jgi:predicted RNA-binding protein with PIN domain